MADRPRTGASRLRVRLPLVVATAAVLVLPAVPLLEAGIGREVWEDPSAGPFVQNWASTWALFVLNLNDVRCGSDLLGNGDLALAQGLRNLLVQQGVPASRVTILLDGGNATYGAATMANLKAWVAATAPQVNALADGRVLLMMTGHGLPYAPAFGAWRFSRPVGSSICLNGGIDVLDYELGAELARFSPHVQLGVAISCSICGGFADRIFGPAPTAGAPTLTEANRVVTAGCAMITECAGHRTKGSYFHQLWIEGVTTGAADGWTWVGGIHSSTPYDSRQRDGRVTLEEAYWYALWRSVTGATDTQATYAASQRFQMHDGIAGGFVLRAGSSSTVANEGTGGCTLDLRDYDGDDVPNAMDTVNGLQESRVALAPGAYVVTDVPTSSIFKLVVTSPSGNALTFVGGQTNTSLDGFAGEPADGTWLFDLRSASPSNHILEVHLSGKTLRDRHAKLLTDAGLTVWNWHANSRTDDSPVLDVDLCPASGLRFYAPVATVGVPP